MVFLGYEAKLKAYKCLDPNNFKVYIIKDVIFEDSKSYKFEKQPSVREISLIH